MKLPEAKVFREAMESLNTLDEHALYSLRSQLPDFFQSGHCTLGVYKLFQQMIKDAIYVRLNDRTVQQMQAPIGTLPLQERKDDTVQDVQRLDKPTDPGVGSGG